mmetsp:Transcript_6967/g.18955  ORF Transcript_6967/g.18955 Transcript_6967/m.18955 type:complete len:209 (-) Transcript_6967:226-852(-)
MVGLEEDADAVVLRDVGIRRNVLLDVAILKEALPCTACRVQAGQRVLVAVHRIEARKVNAFAGHHELLRQLVVADVFHGDHLRAAFRPVLVQHGIVLLHGSHHGPRHAVERALRIARPDKPSDVLQLIALVHGHHLGGLGWGHLVCARAHIPIVHDHEAMRRVGVHRHVLLRVVLDGTGRQHALHIHVHGLELGGLGKGERVPLEPEH